MGQLEEQCPPPPLGRTKFLRVTINFTNRKCFFRPFLAHEFSGPGTPPHPTLSSLFNLAKTERRSVACLLACCLLLVS